MVGFIMDMIRNHHFTVHVGSKKSRYRILKNDVPQGLVLAPALFNVYTYDLATTVCKKYVYTDDLALANSGTDWRILRLLQKLATKAEYQQNYLQYIPSKQQTSYELNVETNSVKIPFEKFPKYLGISLDHTLSYKQHLINTA